MRALAVQATAAAPPLTDAFHPLSLSATSHGASAAVAPQRRPPARKWLRRLLVHENVDVVMAVLVVVYIVIILIDRATLDILEYVDNSRLDSDPNYEPQFTLAMRRAWLQAFWVVDISFLTFFLFECALRVYADTQRYLRSPLNVVDLVLILLSFAISLWVAPLVWGAWSGPDQEQSSRVNSAQVFLLKIARITRLFRLVPACIRVQETRATVHIDRKGREYGRVGSPVERVIAILKRLRREVRMHTMPHEGGGGGGGGAQSRCAGTSAGVLSSRHDPRCTCAGTTPPSTKWCVVLPTRALATPDVLRLLRVRIGRCAGARLLARP